MLNTSGSDASGQPSSEGVDCGAIGGIYKAHKFAASPEMAAAKALKAGCDLSCGVEYGALVGAVRQSLIEEREIDRSVRRLLTARLLLGLFDPREQVSYARIPYSANECPENGALALQTARESVVLLKNAGPLLPLGRKSR
jgi:beta-glucosidase